VLSNDFEVLMLKIKKKWCIFKWKAISKSTMYHNFNHIFVMQIQIGSLSSENNLRDDGLVPTEIHLLLMVNPKMIISQSGSNIYIHLLMNQSQLWWSSYHNILYYRFEIEEEALIISPQDEEQPTYINEAFTFLAKDKWIEVI